jgi:EmrB/QacA subfamily drug resistance transporter
MLSFGGLLLLGARAGDILGRRRTFILGITLFTLASLVGGFAQNPAELLVARAAQGIGGAFASPAALSLLMSKFSDGRERTRAIGLYTAVSVSGGAAGLIAGGVLVQWVSWRWVMFVNVPIGLIVVFLARLVITETERHRGTLDIPGAVTSTAGMASLVYGFVRAATEGWTDSATEIAFVAGLGLLAAFIVIERRAESPITPLRLFYDRNRATAYLGRLLLVAGLNGMFFFLSQFMQNVLGYKPLAAGVAFLPITIMVFASSQLAAKVLIDRFGAKPVMITGIAMSAAGLLTLTQLSADSGYLAVFIPLMLVGTGNGMGFVPLTTAALTNVDAHDQGAASGLVNVMQQVGGSLGLAVLITVFGSASRHVQAHPGGLTGRALADHAFVAGAHRAWELSTVFVFLVLALVVFAMGKIPKHGHPTPEEKLREDLETTGAISATASG